MNMDKLSADSLQRQLEECMNIEYEHSSTARAVLLVRWKPEQAVLVY